jgi:hypothetical protein
MLNTYSTNSSHFLKGFREKKKQTKHGMASGVLKMSISKILPAIFSEDQCILPLLIIYNCLKILFLKGTINNSQSYPI